MRAEAIEKKFEKDLEKKIKKLWDDLYSLQQDTIDKSFYDIEKWNPIAKVAIEVLTGKLGKLNKIPGDIKEIEDLMRKSKLKPDELYKKARDKFNKWIEDYDNKAKTQKSNAGKMKKKKARKESLIKSFFSRYLKNILKDLLDLLRHEIYPEKRKTSRRTTCGAPCLSDGHPCRHEVWEGWICWQHGGAYVGDDTSSASA